MLAPSLGSHLSKLSPKLLLGLSPSLPPSLFRPSLPPFLRPSLPPPSPAPSVRPSLPPHSIAMEAMFACPPRGPVLSAAVLGAARLASFARGL